MVKTFRFLTIQAVVYNNSVKCKYSFNVEKQFFQIIQLRISMQFKCKYGLIVKVISISNYSVLLKQFSLA